ncbi:hypothetical protein POVCU2_0003970 [Plasmodium ovale curtisi]|uniref:Uncharacterized protein n=1 Tax=Plasmodium ovale curtisi TaxID=864141 RepID=A0A1A8VLR8_PLAOA|nr:hypothetical protein POVCU2_0003970 [Plasmodium ovale curtisi]SBS80843.1 hypothetical protein POVCU1_003270 [Plasmodium ovale curtisi]
MWEQTWAQNCTRNHEEAPYPHQHTVEEVCTDVNGSHEQQRDASSHSRNANRYYMYLQEACHNLFCLITAPYTVAFQFVSFHEHTSFSFAEQVNRKNDFHAIYLFAIVKQNGGAK